jgi:adenylate cyclase
MAGFFAELKRRNIYRVAAAYAVVAWVLLQFVNNISPGLNLPNWAISFVIVLLAAGFPIALIFAWIHELAPEAPGVAGRVAAGKMDVVLAGALFAVIGLVSYQQLAPGTRPARQADLEAARAAAATPATAIALAVLPFANLSGDAGQEFFSDGMTEEITSVLAKIPDLRVVGRTSAFQFKGQNRDLRSIGQALSATHLLEGSVRRDGTRLRITAQLIKSDDGVHVWTESYDRELTGVFAIQEDIATAIAGALRMPLGLAPGERLVSNRAIDPESYQSYLRAKT